MAKRFKIKKAFLKGFLYISIASLTALMSDLSGFKQFNEITQVGLAIIVINFILQGFIAWRAYIDQSLTDARKEEQEKLESPKIGDK
jgi:hypothetical protein